MEKTQFYAHKAHEKSSDESKDAKGPKRIRQLSYYIVSVILLNIGIIFGASHLRDLLKYFGFLRCDTKIDTQKNKDAKIQPIFDGFAAFYYRTVFIIASDTLNRPLSSIPSTEIEILERKRTSQFHLDYKLTGRKIRALNFGSYNYLG